MHHQGNSRNPWTREVGVNDRQTRRFTTEAEDRDRGIGGDEELEPLWRNPQEEAASQNHPVFRTGIGGAVRLDPQRAEYLDREGPRWQVNGLGLGAQVDVAVRVNLDEEDRWYLRRFLWRLRDNLPLRAGHYSLNLGASQIHIESGICEGLGQRRGPGGRKLHIGQRCGSQPGSAQIQIGGN